jgi:hypothetical protein
MKFGRTLDIWYAWDVKGVTSFASTAHEVQCIAALFGGETLDDIKAQNIPYLLNFYKSDEGEH